MADGTAKKAAPDRTVAKRPRRTQEERSAEARRILIDVAIRHIRKKSLAYVTMAEIAVEAGMTRGAIQHHFGTRDDYMRAVLGALADRVTASLGKQPPRSKVPGARIRNCVEALGRIVLSRDQRALMDITMSARSVPLLRNDGKQSALRMVDTYRAAWRRWLEGGYSPAAIEKGFMVFQIVCSGVLMIDYSYLDNSKQDDLLALCAELVDAAMVSK